MSDLIERLNNQCCIHCPNQEAADEIESLNAHVAVLESDDHEWYLQAARIKVLEDVLDKLARLGNEPHYGNSDGNMIARAAIAEVNDEWT